MSAAEVESLEAQASPVQLSLSGQAWLDIAVLDGATAVGLDDTEADLRFAALTAVAEYRALALEVGYDFAGDGSWLGVGLIYSGAGRWATIGQFKEPSSLDNQMDDGEGLFVEPAFLGAAFGIGDRLGVQAGLYDERWSVSAMAFNGSLSGDDASGTGQGQSGLALRVTGNWLEDLHRLHVGAYARTLDYDEAGVVLASTPNTGLGAETLFADLRGANEAESSFLSGVEAAWSRSGLHLTAEIARMSFDLPAGDEAATSAYLQASWAVTGETREYSAQKATFSALAPARALTQGGLGAIELNARMDHLDFDSLGRGRATAYSLGASWTPVDNVRLSANVTAERGSGDADGVDSDVLMVRLQTGF